MSDWLSILLFIAAWLIIVFALSARRVRHRARGVAFLVLTYCLALLVFARGGLPGSGREWLLMMPALAYILLGPRFGLIASLLAFAAPVSADPAFPATANKWTSAVKPVQGAPGGWFYDPTITGVGPIAKDKDGEILYAYVAIGSYNLGDNTTDYFTITAGFPGGSEFGFGSSWLRVTETAPSAETLARSSKSTTSTPFSKSTPFTSPSRILQKTAACRSAT